MTSDTLAPLSVIARSGSDEAISHSAEIATPSARNDNKGEPPITVKRACNEASWLFQGNPTLQAPNLNKFQYLNSKLF